MGRLTSPVGVGVGVRVVAARRNRGAEVHDE